MDIILASSSVFKKSLLDNLGIKFSSVDSNIDESRKDNETPRDLVHRLAIEKAQKVAKNNSGIIISSDQVATLADGYGAQDEILTKPKTKENAIKQLKNSSGREIMFLTGLALLNSKTQKTQTHVEEFRVRFRKLTNKQIVSYLNKENALNCSGSFKSEGLGIALIEEMKGNDNNSLIGLPIIKLINMLANEDIHIL